MIPERLEKIDKATLLALVNNPIREKRTIEYGADLGKGRP